MRASYTGANQQLRTAAAYVNTLDSEESFWRQIREKADFTRSNLRSVEIETRLRSSDLEVKIELWTPKPHQKKRYRKTVAVTRSSAPNTLFYHTRFLALTDIGDKVNTIVHEYVRNVDNGDDGQPRAQTGHGDDRAAVKGHSAPYWIGNLAERTYRRARGIVGKVLWRHSHEHDEAPEEDGDIIAEPERPLGSYTEEAAKVSLIEEGGSVRGMIVPVVVASAALAAGALLMKRRSAS